MAIPTDQQFDDAARDLVTVGDVANSPDDTTTTRNGDTVLTLTGAINKMAVSAGKPFDTQEDLFATPIPDPPYIAEVLHDPDPDKNGRYSPVSGAWVKGVDTTSAKIEAVSQTVIENKFPSSWGDYVDGAFKSEDGAVVLGVKRSTGRYVGTPEHVGRVIGEKVLDPRYSDIEHDDTPERNIIWAKKWDGSTVSINDPVPSDVELVTYQSAQGRMQIKAITDDDIVTVASAFNSFNPKLTSGKIEYREKATVSTYTRYKEYPFSQSPVPVTTVTHIIGYGESLAAGTSTNGPILTTSLKPEQVFMFNAGVLSLGREQNASARHIVIDSAGLQFIEPAFSQIKESPILSAAYQYASDNPNRIILVSQHGIGGALISWMVRGNESYDNLVTSASMAKAFAESNGAKYEIAPISYIQGTNDWQTPLSTYAEMLDTLWSQLNEDLKAVSGQTEDIVLVLEQTLAGGGQNDGALAFAQIEKWQQYPQRFRCSNPRYGVPYDPDGGDPPGSGDNSHLTNVGYVMLGASQGFAFRPDYTPLIPLSAVRTGNTVVLEFNDNNLVLDTETIINPPDGNYGFYWKETVEEGQTAAVITNVSLLDNVVTITLDKEPVGSNPQVRIADRNDADAPSPANPAGKGKRCCLRTASLGNDVLGNPVYKRAAIYRINVTQ